MISKFLSNCIAYRIFGQSKFQDSDSLSEFKYFYVAYDGSCFDPDGLAICSEDESGPYQVCVSQEIIQNYVVKVV